MQLWRRNLINLSILNVTINIKTQHSYMGLWRRNLINLSLLNVIINIKTQHDYMGSNNTLAFALRHMKDNTE